MSETPEEVPAGRLQRVKDAMGRRINDPAVAPRVTRASQTQQRIFGRLNAFSAKLSGYLEYYANQSLPATDEEQRLLDSYYRHLRAHVPTMPIQPVFSVLVPAPNPAPGELRDTLASLPLQTYGGWEVCVAHAPHLLPEVAAELADFERRHPGRVRVTSGAAFAGPAAATQGAFEIATGDYLAVLAPGDLLFPNALAEVVKAINEEAALAGAPARLLYTDERVLGPGAIDTYAMYKPDWSWWASLTTDYTSRLAVFEIELARAAGGFDVRLDGAEVHDLMMRCVDVARTVNSEVGPPVRHIPLGVYQRARAIGDAPATGVTWERAQENLAASAQAACTRHDLPATARVLGDPAQVVIEYALPAPTPLVSIIIPTKNSPDLLRTCVESVRLRSTYPHFEIILVDNGSDDPDTLAYYREAQAADPRVRVIEDPAYFNFARLNNAGARAARGDYLVLLNNDIEVLTAVWIEQMLMYAQFPEVGAVGARLLYPNGAIQHAGVVGAGDHVASHTARGLPGDSPHFLAHSVHEAIAVTGAALMIRAALFAELGGLEEHFVPNAYGDVDMCLELRRRGKAVIYTPYAELIHHESASRKRNVELTEMAYMRRKWSDELLNDPYLNLKVFRTGDYIPVGDMANPTPSLTLLRGWLDAQD